jgi:Ras homolog gene family, member A
MSDDTRSWLEPYINVPAGTIKATFVGDGAVGKTCLLLRLAFGDFPQDYVPTVFELGTEVAFTAADGSAVPMMLLDTVSRGDYDRLRPLAYPGTSVMSLVYNVVGPVSFANIEAKWLPEALHFMPNTPLLLIGAKADLASDAAVLAKLAAANEVPIATETARKFAADHGLAFLETSAFTGNGVEELKAKLLELGRVGKQRALARKQKPRCMLL